MRFTVKKLPQVENEISKLELHQQKALLTDYSKIENEGIEFVKVRTLQKGIYEIKTNEIRSLFKFESEQIILIGVVFVKKTKKTPREIIKLAKHRL